MVEACPKGFHSITPYLVVTDPGALIEFLTQAFDAVEIFRLKRHDGSIMHAQVRIGDSMVMLGGATAEWPAMMAGIYLYVGDVDATYERALKAGATSLMSPTDEFWGDRMGGVRDPADNCWWIATHVEDVSDEEIARRAEAAVPTSV
jgi:PhnB protein